MGVRGEIEATGRRGLLAGAAALVAGGLARLSGPGRARAAHDGSDEAFIHANVTNSTADRTQIQGDFGNPPLTVTNGPSAFYQPARDAIQGFCTSGTGAAGVKGVAVSGPGRRHGVIGQTSSETADSAGVLGLATSDTANSTMGVWGRSDSTGTGAIGTFGQSTNGSGVRGLSGG